MKVYRIWFPSFIGSLFGVYAGASAVNGQWISTGGPLGAELRVFEQSGDVLFAAADRGLYRSEDFGSNWDLVLGASTPPITAIGGNSATVFAGTKTGEVLMSTDAGLTWAPRFSPEPGVEITRLIVNEGRLFAVSQLRSPLNDPLPGNLYTSNDMGDTWFFLPTPQQVSRRLFVDDDFILAMTEGFFLHQVMRSFDGGETWDEPPGGLHFRANDIVRYNDALYFYSEHTVRRSTDDGATWDYIFPTGIDVGEQLTVYPLMKAMDDALYIVGSPGVYRSVDGENWTKGTSGFPLNILNVLGWSVGMEKRENSLIVGGAYGVYRGTASTVSGWSPAEEGLANSRIFKISASPAATKIVANVINTLQVDRYSLVSGSWERSSLTGEPTGLAAGVMYELWHDDLTGVVFAGTQTDGIFRSFDDGAMWSAANDGVPEYNGSAGLQFTEIKSFTQKDGVIYAGTSIFEHRNDGGQGFIVAGVGVLRSTNGGGTWNEFNVGLEPLPFHNGPFFEPRFDPIISLATVGDTLIGGGWYFGMYRNVEGVWQPANEGVPPASDGPFALPNTVHTVGNKVYAGLSLSLGANLIVTSDQGLSWQPADGNLPDGVVDAIVDVDGTLFATLAFTGLTELDGVWMSNNEGTFWTKVGNELDGSRVHDLCVKDGDVYAATDGLGVWRLPNSDVLFGDMNCDGEVTMADVGPFTLALSSPLDYVAAFPECRIDAADGNADGMMNGLDIPLFVEAVLPDD